MILNLNGRSTFWAEAISAAPEVYNTIFFDESKLGLFRDKDVLEVGPGNGAQYRRLKDVCRSYAIADIAPGVLTRPVFDNISTKLHLQNYEQDFGMRFDVIHFWRVIHHVLPDEVPGFVAWLRRHVRPTGLVCFDLPHLDLDPSTYGSNGTVTCNGLLTVPHTLAGMVTAFSPAFDAVPVWMESKFYCGRPRSEPQ